MVVKDVQATIRFERTVRLSSGTCSHRYVRERFTDQAIAQATLQVYTQVQEQEP
jgi:hypothetical protein